MGPVGPGVVRVSDEWMVWVCEDEGGDKYQVEGNPLGSGVPR